MSRLLVGPDAVGVTLAIEDGRVVDRVAGDGVDHLDADGARIEPGRVNAHTHIYSGLVPFGMPSPDPPPKDFPDILARIWWRLDRALDAEAIVASARYYGATALLRGTTALIDHHESPTAIPGSLDLIADALDELGVRSLLCYGATERNGGVAEAALGLEECHRFIARNRRPRVVGAVGLHASFTVSDETVRRAGALCNDLGALMHVHLAEDVVDVTEARKAGYAGPLERLLELDALPYGSIAAHGVHLDAVQVGHASEHGVWLVQNPRSNRQNGVGYPRFIGGSDRVALGTDGFPADMVNEEAALASEIERWEVGPQVAGAVPGPGAGLASAAAAAVAAAMPGRVAVGADDARGSAAAARLAAESVHIAAVAAERGRGGHRLLGELFPRAGAFGMLSPGAAADVVVRNEESVRHVIVGGRVVVRHGELVTAKAESIVEEARRQARRLWLRMREEETS